MRTTLILRDDLLAEAAKLTNITEKTKLVHMGLEALIREHARNRLISLGGSDPKAKAPGRRRPA